MCVHKHAVSPNCSLEIEGKNNDLVTSFKLLGLTIDYQLSFDHQISVAALTL